MFMQTAVAGEGIFLYERGLEPLKNFTVKCVGSSDHISHNSASRQGNWNSLHVLMCTFEHIIKNLFNTVPIVFWNMFFSASVLLFI